jgi:Mg-chelatase subunit ChlD
MESRRSIFGSLKQTLSRNKQATSNDTPQAPHPQAKSVSTPTRRPGEQRISSRHAEQILTHRSAALSANPFHSASSFDAPPAYSPAPNAATVASPARTNTAPVADDAYAFLDEFDTVFLIDDSGSMAGSLWRQTADALMTIAPICTAHDADGIDIYFLNHPNDYMNVTDSTAIREIFQTVRPGGATPTGRRLHKLLKDYLVAYTARPNTTKPMNIICITDGVPTDDDEDPLIKTAKKLDDLDAPAWQVGIQFFQVGRDPEASKHLKMLDDELAEIAGKDDLRDIVDTVPFTNANGGRLTADGILKVVLGAVTRRLDRKSKELHR